MDADLLFVVGLSLGVFTIPAILSALIDGRPPRTAAFLVIIGGLMVGYAVLEKPNSYRIDTIPSVFAKVIARYAS